MDLEFGDELVAGLIPKAIRGSVFLADPLRMQGCFCALFPRLSGQAVALIAPE